MLNLGDYCATSCIGPIVLTQWVLQLWNVERSRSFIKKEYGWFLNTYDNYRFPVQRIDALRYFLMRHYGGIYIDLDNVSAASGLESLLFSN